MNPTDRTTLRRRPERGSHDRESMYAVLDEALICHVGFNDSEGRPVVIPMIHARVGDRIYIHGARASRAIRAVGSGRAVSLVATIVDGLVLAASSFAHSMNYRSVVVFGSGVPVADEREKRDALDAITDKVMRGRRQSLRPMTSKEAGATGVVAIDIVEASMKQRSGPTNDDEDWKVWKGVVPLRIIADEPVPDPGCDVPIPDHLSAYLGRLTTTD